MRFLILLILFMFNVAYAGDPTPAATATPVKLIGSDASGDSSSGLWVQATSNGLKVDATSTITPVTGTLTCNQGSPPWSVNQSGFWDIRHITGTISLPTGAATSALQSTANASLSSIDSKLTAPLSVTGPLTNSELRASAVVVDGSGVTQPISASSLPLPTGAATAANQATANASLSSIDSKLTSPLSVTGPLTDTQLRATPVPISVASLPLPSGAATEATLTSFKSANHSDLSDIYTSTTSINSVLSSFSATNDSHLSNIEALLASPVAVSVSSLPLPAGASTAANQTTANASLASIDSKLTSPISTNATQSGTWNINNISGTITLPTGASTSANQATANTSLSNIDGKLPALVSGRIPVDGSGVTQPISASSLPLPTGAATASNQSTANTTLASIDSKLTAPLSVTGPLTDTQLRATPVPVSGTVTSNQGGTWNINNISGVVSLPTGAATSANQSTANTTLSSILSAITSSQPRAVTQSTNPWIVSGSAAVGAPPVVNPVSVSGVDGSGLKRHLLTESDGKLQTMMYGSIYSSYSPNLTNVPDGDWSLTLDASGRLETHSAVTTDEGSFRDDFSGSALATTLTGTVSFTNNSTAVTGTGTAFTTQVKILDYVKKSADTEARWVQVCSVESDTALTLCDVYGGTTAAATSQVNHWATITGTGGSISVASGIAAVVQGSNNNQTTGIFHAADYGPFVAKFYAQLSARNPNQTVVIGGAQAIPSTGASAYFAFSGTVNTAGSCVSSYDGTAANTQTTAFTFPNSGTSATYHKYEIDISDDNVSFLVDGVKVCSNDLHVPDSYAFQELVAYIQNTGVPGASTTLNVDWALFKNVDQLETTSSFNGNPQLAATTYEPTQSTATAGDTTALKSDRFGNLAITSRNSYRNIVGAATTTVKSGAGRLSRVCMNDAVSATYTIYDNTAGSGTKIATITNTASQPSTCLQYEVEFSTGLTVVSTGAATDLTIVYQ